LREDFEKYAFVLDNDVHEGSAAAIDTITNLKTAISSQLMAVVVDEAPLLAELNKDMEIWENDPVCTSDNKNGSKSFLRSEVDNRERSDFLPLQAA
jgi:uncharacterized phosphosugar-binding protein